MFSCRAYPPADSRQPKPFLLPGFILPPIGCGSKFYFVFYVGFFRRCCSFFGDSVILFVFSRP